MQNAVKKQVNSGVSQFELTQKLLQNLYKFKLTPTAKMVLMYLSSCYNPKHAEMFPKQRTIADKLGISEASVIRAICELHKEGLIISERKYTNRYKYTSKFLISLGILGNKMQVENSQNESKGTCKLQPLLIEPIREPNKKQNSYKNYFQKNAYVDPQRYQTGETKRIEKIMNEDIEQMPPEFFKDFRAKLAARCS